MSFVLKMHMTGLPPGRAAQNCSTLHRLTPCVITRRTMGPTSTPSTFKMLWHTQLSDIELNGICVCGCVAVDSGGENAFVKISVFATSAAAVVKSKFVAAIVRGESESVCDAVCAKLVLVAIFSRSFQSRMIWFPCDTKKNLQQSTQLDHATNSTT